MKRTRERHKYLEFSHVHDAPPHFRAGTHVSAEHVRDDDLGKIDVGSAAEPVIVEILRDARASATRHEDLKRVSGGGGGNGLELGEKRVAELRPLGVPFEGVAGAPDSEEFVPILFAREVPEGVEDLGGSFSSLLLFHDGSGDNANGRGNRGLPGPLGELGFKRNGLERVYYGSLDFAIYFFFFGD